MKSTKETRVAIIVELKNRELPFLVILKSLLEKKGYYVKFISFRNHCTISLMRFRPDIILINGLRTTYTPFVSQIYLPKKNFKSKIICYYSEQVGLYNQTIAYGYNNPLILRNIDCHVSWGRRFSRDLISMGVHPSKSWFIGSMQYDLDYYLQESPKRLRDQFASKYSLDRNSKWLLYCDNIMRRYTNVNVFPIRREESYKIIEQIASKNPDSIIVFRPHPETTPPEIEDMQNRFASYNNVVVNAEGHLFYWLMSCDGLLIWQSTSGIQSIFLNKKVFGFKTSDGQDENLYWYKDMFPIYEDHTKLIEDVTQFLKSGVCVRFDELAQAREKYIEDFYFRKDGLSFNRLIDLIDRLKKQPKEKYTDEDFSTWKIVKLFLYEIKMWLIKSIRGTVSEYRVSDTDILNERSKYNLEKYSELNFKAIETEDGRYLENE